MRDAWMRCMLQALTEAKIPEETFLFLKSRLGEVADFLRNG
jgi:truncated hemoglobin YjbI